MLWTKSIAMFSGLTLLLFGADKVKAPALDRADQTYKTAIATAQTEFDRAKSKAMEAHQKAYKDALAATTRGGDFDAAAAIKQAMTEFEASDGAVTKRSKPKETVKFEDREYAVIRDPQPWNIAKRICEEMGGHLAIINSAKELDFLKKTSLSTKAECWIGVTDEVEEGKWIWVDGSMADPKMFETDNYNGAEHSIYFAKDGVLRDLYSGTRHIFICEWD